ncbi:PASTA domain-containing protein [Mycobacterium asiaticum]|uniref:PASTA domain-containing protein n=1 Tax=Mycobacterium asiaticum TaxID=1790 RepID=A0A1A3N3W2_MYCAS|nr:PASTA domain-containing protein [Mycobacterium asiaticum]OBK15744.1 hypothetical protein A5636_05225 [Mycobacterium asiaticum]
MRLGIGGGAFGIRGGISTRGIGVGVGPLSAGTSWKGGGSRGGGGGGLLAWLLGAAVIFFVAAWPYLLGTYIAVESGAEDPSTARFVVGWCFEVVYIAGLLAWFLIARDKRAQQVAQEDQRMAEVIASGVVYEAQHGRSVVYRHGTCTVNHKSPDTAANCRKSAPSSALGELESTGTASETALSVRSTVNRSALNWPAVILGVGLVVGLVILLVDPIHRIPSPAEQARSKPCPVPISIDETPANITMPDFVGQNAGGVEAGLEALGLTSVELSSANPKYKSVWVASNWTVVSTDPNPGCTLGRHNSVVVYVTKP